MAYFLKHVCYKKQTNIQTKKQRNGQANKQTNTKQNQKKMVILKFQTCVF